MTVTTDYELVQLQRMKLLWQTNLDWTAAQQAHFLRLLHELRAVSQPCAHAHTKPSNCEFRAGVRLGVINQNDRMCGDCKFIAWNHNNQQEEPNA